MGVEEGSAEEVLGQEQVVPESPFAEFPSEVREVLDYIVSAQRDAEAYSERAHQGVGEARAEAERAKYRAIGARAALATLCPPAEGEPSWSARIAEAIRAGYTPPPSGRHISF